MSDFINTTYKSPPPILSGVMEQLITQPINADFAEVNQTWSFAYYRRISLTGINAVRLTFQVPDDYYYHLDEIRFRWTGKEIAGRNLINAQLKQVGRNREFSPTDIPVQLTSTPADGRLLRYVLKSNHTFFPSDKVLLVVRGEERNDESERDVDIVLTGLRIPKDFIIQE